MLLPRRALVLLPLAAGAQAQTACGGPYEVGLAVSGHLAYEDGPQRQPTGLLVDVVQELARRGRLNLRVSCYPLQRLVRMIKLGELPARRIDISLDASAVLRKLVVGRVQAVVSMPLLQRVMEVEEYPWERLHGRSLPQAGTSIGGLELNPARLCEADAARLRQHLRQLRDDGSLYRLLRKHLGVQAQPWMVWRPGKA